MKRIYKSVSTAPAADANGVTILLDERPVRTPMGALLVVPNQALAALLVAEWSAQADDILPASMPFNQLANSAVDLTAANRAQVIETLSGYVNADLICYRAERPDDLVLAQSRHWQPLVNWMQGRFEVALAVTTGLEQTPQDPALERAVRARLEGLNNFELTGVNELTTISQSLTIALALLEERLDVAAAWQAARVDEDYQEGRWGIDGEAKLRADRLLVDFRQADELIRLCRP